MRDAEPPNFVTVSWSQIRGSPTRAAAPRIDKSTVETSVDQQLSAMTHPCALGKGNELVVGDLARNHLRGPAAAGGERKRTERGGRSKSRGAARPSACARLPGAASSKRHGDQAPMSPAELEKPGEKRQQDGEGVQTGGGGARRKTGRAASYSMLWKADHHGKRRRGPAGTVVDARPRWRGRGPPWRDERDDDVETAA